MDKATLLRYLARILIIALTLYLAWLYLPGKSDLGNVAHTTQNQKIAIIPTGKIPLRFLQNLESRLEEQHGVDVLVTTEMGLNNNWIFPEQNQYNANYLEVGGSTEPEGRHDHKSLVYDFPERNPICRAFKGSLLENGFGVRV